MQQWTWKPTLISVSLGKTTQNMTGEYGGSNFNFLRHVQTVFHKDCTSLHSCHSALSFLYPCTLTVFVVFGFLVVAVLPGLRGELVMVWTGGGVWLPFFCPCVSLVCWHFGLLFTFCFCMFVQMFCLVRDLKSLSSESGVWSAKADCILACSPAGGMIWRTASQRGNCHIAFSLGLLASLGLLGTC